MGDICTQIKSASIHVKVKDIMKFDEVTYNRFLNRGNREKCIITAPTIGQFTPKINMRQFMTRYNIYEINS